MVVLASKLIYFTDAMIKQANWQSTKIRDKLRRDIDAHVAAVRTSELSELTTSYEVLNSCDWTLGNIASILSSVSR